MEVLPRYYGLPVQTPSFLANLNSNYSNVE